MGQHQNLSEACIGVLETLSFIKKNSVLEPEKLGWGGGGCVQIKKWNVPIR